MAKGQWLLENNFLNYTFLLNNLQAKITYPELEEAFLVDSSLTVVVETLEAETLASKLL